MIRKIALILILSCLISPAVSYSTFGEQVAGEVSEGNISLFYRNVTVYAPAVASTDDGYVGVISTISVTIQSNGSGHVFVDTLPLTQVDMQGSARLAVKVASALVENDKSCNVTPANFDYFFVVRTSSPIIGGPSAGAIMTVATIALLENWSLDENTIMTGMINPDGSIGPIGGIPQKIDAANSVGATRFLIPEGQGIYTEYDGFSLVTRNVEDYAMSNYGIQVVEIAEINQAIENFTGYSFSIEESGDIITTEDYNKSMKPLATRLLEEAENAYLNSSSKLENSSIPYYYLEGVEQRLEDAKTSLDESKSWFDQHLYYTSTSKSFQSLISSRCVNYSVTYFDLDNASYINSLLEEAESYYDETNLIAKNAIINDFISLQSVGAAQRRASEAKIYLDDLDTSSFFTYSSLLSFFYDIAFIIERLNSVNWWIEIGNQFNTTAEITNITIENIALEYLDEAQQAIVYSDVILSEMGLTSGDAISYLSSAQSLLETSQNDFDGGYPAAALFEALEALVKANLALEIIGTNAENKIDLASNQASSSITKSRKLGIEPILAVSYYEYAESLSNESQYESALIYYKYSGMIAGAIAFTNITSGTSASRFVGILENEPHLFSWIFGQTTLIAIIFILGLLFGLGSGLIIAGLLKKEPPKKPQTSIYKPSKYDYPGDQIPRSIQDYYKKNK